MNFFRNFLLPIIFVIQVFHVIQPMATGITAQAVTFASKSEKLAYQFINALIKQPALLNNSEVISNLMTLDIDILKPLLATNLLPQFTVQFIKQSSDTQFLQIIEMNVELAKNPAIRKRFYSLGADKIVSFFIQPFNANLVTLLGSNMPEMLLNEILIHEQLAQQNPWVFDSLKSARAKQQRGIMKAMHSMPAVWKDFVFLVLNKVIEFHYGSKKVDFAVEVYIREIADQMGISQDFSIRRINACDSESQNRYALTIGRHIYIDEAALAELPSGERNFAIAHELAHLFHQHSYEKLAYAVGNAALSGIESYSVYYFSQKFNKATSGNQQLNIMAAKASICLMNFVAKHQLLKHAQKMMHLQEFEADSMAVEKLPVKDGATEFFKRNILSNISMQDQDTLSHPSLARRIAALSDPNVASSSNQKMNTYTLREHLQSTSIPSLECGVVPFAAAPVLIASGIAGLSFAQFVTICAGGGVVSYAYIKIGTELYTIYKQNQADKKSNKGTDKDKGKDSKKSDGSKDPKDKKDKKDKKKGPKRGPIFGKDKKKKRRTGQDQASSSQSAEKKRNTEKISSAEFMTKSPFADLVKGKVSVKAFGDRKTFTLLEKVNHPFLKKGYKFEFDLAHGNHIEVYNKRGVFEYVLNLDLTKNIDKTKAAFGRTIQI